MLFGRKTASETAQEAVAAQAAASVRPVPRPSSGGNEFKRLGQLLIDEGLITTGQLEKALEEQTTKGGFLGQILVKQGSVSQAAVSSCLVKQCKIPHLSLLDYEISQDVLALLPTEVCRKHHLLPIDKMGRILTMAMVDPLDTEALEIVRHHCPDLKIKPILCNWEHYELVSAKLWSNTGSSVRHAMTAESLGLRDLPAAPRPTDKYPTPVPGAPQITPAPQEPQVQHVASSSTHVDTHLAAEDLSAMRESARSAVEDAMRAMAAHAPQAPAAPQVSADEIANAVRGAVMDAVSAISVQRPEVPAPDLSGLGAMLKDSVQEAVLAVAKELRPAAPYPSPTAVPVVQQPAGPSAAELAAAIQVSVGGAMQEAMATMMAQFRAMTPQRDDGQAEALAGAVRDSVREALQSALQVQTAQGERLAQIAEAALQSAKQSAQMAEATAVAKQTEQELLHGPQGRHASVAPFRGGASGTMDGDVKVSDALVSDRPLDSMNFDNFVPGAVNGFTFRVCQEIASKPGGEYNPLFLFGHVGAGKTHLISAVGNHILKASPRARVGYVSASHFARRLREAIAENALDAFRDNYAHWDVLILDDIQFLAGRVEAQEEFFHIFNALHQQGRQIIIASDKAPDRLGQLEQRLISRFASGIVAELKAPEWEARMAILRQQVQQSGVKVPDPVVSLIAMRVSDDVRKMTGSLRKIIAYAQLGGKDITCEMAEEILSHLGSVAAA